MGKLRELSADEAADLIKDGQVVGFSGFTAAGNPKLVPVALAEKAKKEQEAGRKFKITAYAGASVGDSLDGSLARSKAMSFRAPYQSNPSLRSEINSNQVSYCDYHLSHFPQQLSYGFFGEIDWAVIEACDVTEQGEIVLTSSVGTSPTFCELAKNIIIELNEASTKSLKGMHDIYSPARPPFRKEIPLYAPEDRIGDLVVKVDPSKIVGIVRTNLPDEGSEFKDSNDVNVRIGNNVAEFLVNEIKNNRVPKEFLPIQSGVGNIANALLKAMGENPSLPRFKMYTEVAQKAVIELVKQDRVSFVSTCALTINKDLAEEVYANLDYFRERMVLRPQEISNNPEIIRRLGVISINTAIEADLFGHINSTHTFGNKLMNGIGGSGDFTRNAYISIFTMPSTAKDGKISTIVPFCSHVDHNEHSVQVVVTEHGVADLRGKDPRQRALEIIENCACPSYRPILKDYLNMQKNGHIPQTLAKAFSMHEAFLNCGDMRSVEFK